MFLHLRATQKYGKILPLSIKTMALDYKNLKSFLLKQFMQSQRHVIG